MCGKCDMPFVTQKCYDLHKPVCYHRWHCQLCSRTFCLSPKTAQQIKAEHTCYLNNKCKHCRLNYSPDDYHLCTIPKIKGDKYWPNLVFFQFAYQNLYSANCLKCFELQTEYCNQNKIEFNDFRKQKVYGNILCSIHAAKTTSNNKPNACVLFRETSRGNFKEYIICDDNLLSDNHTKQSCDFTSVYTHPDVDEPYQNVNIGGVKRVRTNDFTAKIKKLQEKVEKTMLEKFFLLVTQREWENSVYISHEAHIVNLPSILETFLSFGIIPNLIQKNASIHSLEIPILKRRFFNGSSFLSGNIEEICKQFEVPYEPVYFPENYNCEENYEYSGAPLI